MKQNQDAGKISAFLTIENGSLIDGKMDKIREIYDLGVRLVTLTWNDDNCLGHCHSQKPEEMSRGLTGFGKEAVRYMQELGILVDVSIYPTEVSGMSQKRPGEAACHSWHHIPTAGHWRRQRAILPTR